MILSKNEIYFNDFPSTGEKREGFFEQQLDAVPLTFEIFGARLFACFSGIGSEHDRPIKMTGIKAISIFRIKTELIIKLLKKNYLAHLNPRLLMPESGELFIRRATR